MKVTASEFQKKFGEFKEIAQREAVTITSNGRDSVVLISARAFEELTKASKAYDGEISKAFEADLADLMKKHNGVLKGLAK